jgi:hypothetical protein
MLRSMALVRTDVSVKFSVSIINVIRIGELGTMLAVTSNRRTLWRRRHSSSVSLSVCFSVCQLTVQVFSKHLFPSCALPRVLVSAYASRDEHELLRCEDTALSLRRYCVVSLAKCLYIRTWRRNNIICSRWPGLQAVFTAKWLKYFRP